jgi:hypothetical protein
LQFAELAGLEIQDQRSVADAANLFDVVSDLLKHLAQFAVTALNQHHFVPGVVAAADLANLCRRSLHASGTRLFAIDADTAAEAFDRLFRGFATDFDEISFFHSRGGAGQLVGQFAVVGHQQQTLAEVIEAANGINAFLDLCEEFHHRGPVLGIAHGGDEALGLVEHEVAQALRALQELAVDANVIANRVGLGAEFGHDFAVDLYTSFGDQFFGVAAAGDAGLGEDFLEAVQLCGRFWSGFSLFGFVFAFGYFFRAVFGQFGSIVAGSVDGSFCFNGIFFRVFRAVCFLWIGAMVIAHGKLGSACSVSERVRQARYFLDEAGLARRFCLMNGLVGFAR